MSEEKIKKIEQANLKLSVFKSFPYERLKQVCDAICDLGFECEFVDNGNIVFSDIGEKKQEGLYCDEVYN